MWSKNIIYSVRNLSLLWEKLTVEVKEEVGSRIDKPNTRWSVRSINESTGWSTGLKEMESRLHWMDATSRANWMVEDKADKSGRLIIIYTLSYLSIHTRTRIHFTYTTTTL